MYYFNRFFFFLFLVFSFLFVVYISGVLFPYYTEMVKCFVNIRDYSELTIDGEELFSSLHLLSLILLFSQYSLPFAYQHPWPRH